MKILLDSHAFVWFVLGNPRCTPTARERIERPGTTTFVSAASVWEIATKVRIGKWPECVAIVQYFDRVMTANKFAALPVSMEHGRIAGLFTSSHKDPFDRMLAAQAKIEKMPLITADRRLDSFEIETIW